ncbi:PucR family transcriptional regulator ligand-binding domain-containing protein [Paenibacillus sp. PDC88]|uniref:PucR family transcriptional regulator ligand-binding domain-containing protein n=1 Tax=Paenibacillus sp. PDC88 TaxID=1884375 RepID=UPI000894E0B6|nr:PucR family transcriptional regulator ligand-binding domain-containing protein [Paenibacillus sp. PDC88]SDX89381.1 purine catabolism regulatory protein [Paenibacillus sp. PDC88]
MTTADKTGFTCGDILLLPYFSETVVLAGANGLNRPITRVNVLEVPDVIDWVRPGEFLITTGFPFRDDPDAIAEMIPKLYEKGVSALGIKTKRFIDRIPEMALEIAERMDFPVFQLPPSTVFSDVVRAIMERILVKEARELSLLQSRFQKLSQLLLYGGGIGELLGAMDEMLNNPVILLDSRDQVVLSPRAEQIVGLSRDSAIWPHLRNEINLGVSFITLEDRRIRAQISSFSDKNRNENLLILLEWDQETSVLDQLTIERVGVLVGLEMINANARKEVESKYIDQFLQDWISGRFVTLEDLNIRAKACGCPIHDGYCHYVGLIRWHGSRMTVQTQQQMVERLRSTFFRKDIQFTILEGELALLVSLPANKSMSEALERALTDLRRWFPGDNPYSICMGNGVVRPERAGESYSRAKKIGYS